MRISYLLFELGSRGITVVVEIIITVLINIRWYVANSLEDVDGTRIYIYFVELFLDRFLTSLPPVMDRCYDILVTT